VPNKACGTGPLGQRRRRDGVGDGDRPPRHVGVQPFDHAAVDLAVKATRAEPASAPFAALANAVLRAIARGEGPEDAFLVLGYAGWESGQLEDEIRANAWLSAPVDLGLIFELPLESRWQAAGRLLGVDLSRVSPTGGNA